MKLELPPLPYAKDALAPYIGAKTVHIHYEKHHRGYYTKVNAAVTDTPRANCTLEQLVCEAQGDLFNNAAQAWNHDFYWRCMRPDGGGAPGGELATMIERDLGSYSHFCRSLAEAANEQFGSGWAWLALDSRGKLQVIATGDADNPLRHHMIPLLAVDVWEHAYYLDYQSERDKYVEAFIEHLIDWDAVAARFVELGSKASPSQSAHAHP